MVCWRLRSAVGFPAGAGFVIVEVDSIEEAGRITLRYIDVVGAHEVDIRELVD